MINRVSIPKNELKSLYKNKKLTIPEVAKFYNCSTSKIWANLWGYNIRRSRCKKIHISKITLENLYLKEKLSTTKIAEIFKCGKATIQARMKDYNILARSRSEALRLISHSEKYKISRDKLRKLYWKKELSIYKIAKIYSCSPSAIFAKFKKFDIPRRTDLEGVRLTIKEKSPKIAKALSRYSKRDFNGTMDEKAYLIGFSLGDMNVRKQKYGQTIYVASATTKREQIKLMESLFTRFGHTRVNERKLISKKKEIAMFQFIAHLSLSFDFLLDKKDEIKGWIFEKDNYFLHFLAGYIDAEGSFGVYNGFGEFALSSYGKSIINQIYYKLNLLGIKMTAPRITVRGGYVDKRGVKTHKNLWSLKMRRKNELFKFINLIGPFLRHAKRKSDLLKVEQNIISRQKVKKL